MGWTLHQRSAVSAGLRCGGRLQVNEAAVDVTAEGEGILADSEGAKQDVERLVDVSRSATDPNEDIGARASLQPTDREVDLPDAEHRCIHWAQVLSALFEDQPEPSSHRTSRDGDKPATRRKQRYAHQHLQFTRTAHELERLLMRWEQQRGESSAHLAEEFVSDCEAVISVQNEAWMVRWTRD
ncbi:hypothetical protein ACWD7F_39305 [Streptomyces sp. NPDC005122]